jgi:hypothetical protein
MTAFFLLATAVSVLVSALIFGLAVAAMFFSFGLHNSSA